jgi:hypothetical protein
MLVMMLVMEQVLELVLELVTMTKVRLAMTKKVHR